MRHENSVVVNRPVEEVWGFLTQPFNIPRFLVFGLGVRITSPGPIRVGTTIQGRIVVFGLEKRLSAVVTEWDPPHAFTFSGRGLGTRSITFRETHQANAGGTSIVRVVEFEPRPAFRFLWWILAPWFKRRLDASTGNIKRVLESGGRPGPGGSIDAL